MTTKNKQTKIKLFNVFGNAQSFKINKVSLDAIYYIFNAIKSINNSNVHCDKIYIEYPITLTDIDDWDKHYKLIAYIYRFNIIIAIDNIEYYLRQHN